MKKCNSCSQESNELSVTCDSCGAKLEKESLLQRALFSPYRFYKRLIATYNPFLVWLVIALILLQGTYIGSLLALPPEVRQQYLPKSTSEPVELFGTKDDAPDFSRKPGVCEVYRPVSRTMIEIAAKYPDEARIPPCSEFTLKNLYGDEYQLEGYIISPNSFGVEGRISFTLRMTYKGGNPSDMANWVFQDPIITE